MRELAIRIYQYCLQKLKARKAIAYAVGAMLTVFLWIYHPLIFNQPYYRVEGSKFSLELDPLSREVNIKIFFVKAKPKLELASLFVHHDGTNAGNEQSFNVGVESQQDSSAVVLALKVDLRDVLEQVASQPPTKGKYYIALTFGRRPFLDIRKIEIGQDVYPAQSIGNLLWGTNGTLMKTVLVREVIADKILEYNDSVGNYFMAMLSVVALWLFGRVITTAVNFANAAKRKLDIQKKIQIGISSDTLKDELLTRYWEKERILSFWKIIGPSTGFLLTVSSLAAALHPNIQSDQGAYTFFSSVQVAIISTFIGLAIRLFAHLEITMAQAILRDDYQMLPDKSDEK